MIGPTVRFGYMKMYDHFSHLKGSSYYVGQFLLYCKT